MMIKENSFVKKKKTINPENLGILKEVGMSLSTLNKHTTSLVNHGDGDYMLLTYMLGSLVFINHGMNSEVCTAIISAPVQPNTVELKG